MGDFDAILLGIVESSVEYHPILMLILTQHRESGARTVPGG